jgi:hypothetical protein
MLTAWMLSSLRGRPDVGLKRPGSAHPGWSNGPALASAIGAGVTPGPLSRLRGQEIFLLRLSALRRRGHPTLQPPAQLLVTDSNQELRRRRPRQLGRKHGQRYKQHTVRYRTNHTRAFDAATTTPIEASIAAIS